MNVNIPARFRGTYEFTLKRKDGTVQKETIHNIATSNIVSVTSSSSLSIGSGSGKPANTDTKLFTHLWNIAASTISQVQNVGDDGARMTLTYIVPATAAYVATITEVGMGTANAIWTHALLVDAEGNPISIVKTENDELTIVVTLELYASTILPLTNRFDSFVSASIKPTLAAILLARSVSSARQYRLLIGGTTSDSTYINDRISIRPCNILTPYGARYADSDNGVTPIYAAWTADKTLMQLKLTDNLRCKNDAFNTHYYRYLQVAWGVQHGYNSIGSSATYFLVDTPMALDLKNPDIFPPQLLSNITLATGDGETTDFACPLNYFQKDTEVVYKNGVRLTRGVDYTIENDANKDRLPELMHILYSDDTDIKITSDASLWDKGNYLQFMAESGKSKGSYAIYDTTKVCTAFDHVYPLHFDWGAPRKCNCLQGILRAYYVGTMYVEYSADNSHWEQAASQVVNIDGSVDTPVDLTWEPVEAQYWRIRVTRLSSAASSRITYAYFNTGKDAFLGYSNPLGVHFTTPPTENDVITMDCYVDIPLKSSNFAFNLALDLTITFS